MNAETVVKNGGSGTAPSGNTQNTDKAPLLSSETRRGRHAHDSRGPRLYFTVIVSMSAWDEDYFNEEVQAFIEFEDEMMGRFQFGAVRGFIDCRYDTRGGLPAVEFSWEGQNDSDPGCGRGWGVLRDGGIEGRLFFHTGDDSWFKASRAPKPITIKRRSRQ
jgi:hypothetical protein